MKSFKSVDDKIKDLGYELTEASPHKIVYTRENDFGKHRVALYKCIRNHIAFSYDPDSPNKTAIGLTVEEMGLFLKIMKQM